MPWQIWAPIFNWFFRQVWRVEKVGLLVSCIREEEEEVAKDGASLASSALSCNQVNTIRPFIAGDAPSQRWWRSSDTISKFHQYQFQWKSEHLNILPRSSEQGFVASHIQKNFCALFHWRWNALGLFSSSHSQAGSTYWRIVFVFPEEFLLRW